MPHDHMTSRHVQEAHETSLPSWLLTNEVLRAQSKQRKWSAQGQTSPLSEGTRVPEPKRPGLNPDSGPFC
jgi:hypothetical protein